jgi:hypothetical protein
MICALLPLINCQKRYRFKKAAFYEREVMKKQQFFIRWQKLRTHTTGG